MNRTSFGVCRRDEVIVKMFSGEKYGRVETRAMRAQMKSIFREEITGRGTGCTGAGATRVFTFCVRYHVIIFGTRRGPTVKQRVLRLLQD